MTTICSAGHPRATARWRSAYWRAVDSVLLSTWRSVDWRTYKKAVRARCEAVTLVAVSTLIGAHPDPRQARAIVASAPTSSSPAPAGTSAGGRRRARGDRLAGSQPGGDTAALQHRQAQPPPGCLAAQGAPAQHLVAFDVGAVAAALTGRLRFWAAAGGPTPARSNGDAPLSRSARRPRRRDRRPATTDRPPAAAVARRPPRR